MDASPVSAVITPSPQPSATPAVAEEGETGEGEEATEETATEEALPATSAVIGSHVVQPGETLFCIGRAYKVLPEAIAHSNTFARDAILSPGETLNIPNIPWSNDIPGEICDPQFQSPFVPAPTMTITPSPDLSGSSSEQAVTPEQAENTNLELDAGLPAGVSTPTQSLITETRKILVDVPINMTLGESLEVNLTFNPEELNSTTSTVTESVEPTSTLMPERRVSPPAFSDVRHYNNYLLFATARLDAPGFIFSPSTDVKRIVRLGEEVIYRWSIKPIEAEKQTLLISLWLTYEPKRPDIEPLTEGMYWSAPFVVEVSQTLFGITAKTQQTISLVTAAGGTIPFFIGLIPSFVGLIKREEEPDSQTD